MVEPALKLAEEKDSVLKNVRSALRGLELPEGKMDDHDRKTTLNEAVMTIVRIQNGGAIEQLLKQGRFSEAEKSFEQTLARVAESDKTKQEMRAAFKKERASIAWERQADSLGEKMLFRRVLEYFKDEKHAEDAQRFYASAGKEYERAFREFMEYAYQNMNDRNLYRLFSEQTIVSAAMSVLRNARFREGRALAAELEKTFQDKQGNFAVVEKMGSEYLHGNYAAVAALDAAASKSMDSAYKLATSPAMLLLAARMIQERQKVYENVLGGLTIAFIGISPTSEGKVAAGEVRKEGGISREAQARAEVEAARIAEITITQAIVELPQIAQEQGIGLTQVVAPEIIVRGGQVEREAGEPPKFGGGAVAKVRGGGKTAEIEVAAAEARKAEPSVAGVKVVKERGETSIAEIEVKPSVAKVGEERGVKEIKVALTLSSEEQTVYAAAMVRVRELIGEEVAKVEGEGNVRKRA